MSSKDKSLPAMEDAKPGLVPKLRFPEFRGTEGWADKTFDQLFTIGNGKDYKHLETGDVPVYGSGGYMLSVNDYLYDGDSVCIGRKGTIDNPMFLSGRFWTVDTLFYTHSFKECVPKFIFAIFQQIDWLKHNEAGGVPSLSKTNIQKIHTAVPKPAEQQKIAECLSSVDELIAAQARKVDALKIHKKGLMQQLFPCDGETQPRSRFPEFQDAGEWSEEQLDDLVHFQDGFAFKSTDFVKAQKHTTQVIRITDINNTNTNDDKVFIPTAFLEENKLEKYRVDDGDLLLSLTGAAGFNFFLWNGGPAAINQRTAKVTSKSKSGDALLRLLDPLIHEKINERGEGQNNNLSKEFLSTIVIRVPKPEEQQRISACRSSLDALIAVEMKKLEVLKRHKRGLMQQLFPSPEEVEV